MKTSCVSGLVAIFMAAALASAQQSSPKLLVLNKEEGTLAIVDPESGTILGRVPVGQGPHELVTSSDGKYAFASNYGTGPAPGHTISPAASCTSPLKGANRSRATIRRLTGSTGSSKPVSRRRIWCW